MQNAHPCKEAKLEKSVMCENFSPYIYLAQKIVEQVSVRQKKLEILGKKGQRQGMHGPDNNCIFSNVGIFKSPINYKLELHKKARSRYSVRARFGLEKI
jgi:hypothetical protein